MERTSSKSPPRLSPLTRQLSGLGARIGNVFGGGGSSTKVYDVDDRSSVAFTDTDTLAEGTVIDDVKEKTRSVSRGREAFKSTGRGGAGNIHASPGNGIRDEPTNYSPVRGRELDTDPDKQAQSVGRGGVGNIRSRSRTRAAAVIPDGHPQTQSLVHENQASTAAYERQVIEDANKANLVHSSGRGGAGNISGSRSRSRGPGKLFGNGGSDSPRRSTGRGGMGNIHPGADGTTPVDEGDAYRVSHDQDGIHSTGRGGAANLTDLHSPPPEVHSHQHPDFESSGRGGRGNIRSRSTSRDPPRSASHDRFAKIWHKVTNQRTPQEIAEEPPMHADAAAGIAHNGRLIGAQE